MAPPHVSWRQEKAVSILFIIIIFLTCCLQHPREALQGTEALFSEEIRGSCYASMAGRVASTPLLTDKVVWRALWGWGGLKWGSSSSWCVAGALAHTQVQHKLGHKEGMRLPSSTHGQIQNWISALMIWNLSNLPFILHKQMSAGKHTAFLCTVSVVPSALPLAFPAVSSSFLSSGIRAQCLLALKSQPCSISWHLAFSLFFSLSFTPQLQAQALSRTYRNLDLALIPESKALVSPFLFGMCWPVAAV